MAKNRELSSIEHGLAEAIKNLKTEIIDPLDFDLSGIFKPHFAYANGRTPDDLQSLAEKIAAADCFVTSDGPTLYLARSAQHTAYRSTYHVCQGPLTKWTILLKDIANLQQSYLLTRPGSFLFAPIPSLPSLA